VLYLKSVCSLERCGCRGFLRCNFRRVLHVRRRWRRRRPSDRRSRLRLRRSRRRRRWWRRRRRRRRRRPRARRWRWLRRLDGQCDRFRVICWEIRPTHTPGKRIRNYVLEFAQRRCVQRRFLRPVGFRALQGLGYVALFLRRFAVTVLRVRALPGLPAAFKNK